MIDPAQLAWDKMNDLLPVVVQDRDGVVRMLGYMNREALEATLASRWVTFFSRSKGRLWTKGETSGNRLRLLSITPDCDGDALLVTADAEGPTCHLGTASCFGEAACPFFPHGLEAVLRSRAGATPESSYTARILSDGTARIAQKVGEEGVEVALAAVTGEPDDLVAEAADLAYHLTLLLQARGRSWADVARELGARHDASRSTASS
jgi:phosphoribosyl-ATP pyrophosphohydrolase/phosphoribosyl-AMP cyclohydrolase